MLYAIWAFLMFAVLLVLGVPWWLGLILLVGLGVVLDYLDIVVIRNVLKIK